MTHSERMVSLQKLGYDAVEARFLSIAALQSGYFLRRQFLSFIGGTKGWKDVALFHKLKANGQCQVSVYRRQRMVYHLCSKPLYDALGEPNNRNRREHQPATIKNKIMSLDFALRHPDGEFLSTEREKLDYFLRTRSFAPEDLPTRLYASPHGNAPAAKHFVESYPIFLTTPKEGPHFCYVDEGLQTTDRFATFLGQYRRLLRLLHDFRVIYVAEEAWLFPSAERVFQRFVASLGNSFDPTNREQERLLAYFKRRRAYENRDFSEFDTPGLIRFREEKNQFAGERYETLYSRWEAGVLALFGSGQSAGDATPGASDPRFSTHVLDYDYDLFGTLTSKNHKRSNTESPTLL